jgi:hypothetical protein
LKSITALEFYLYANWDVGRRNPDTIALNLSWNDPAKPDGADTL